MRAPARISTKHAAWALASALAGCAGEDARPLDGAPPADAAADARDAAAPDCGAPAPTCRDLDFDAANYDRASGLLVLPLRPSARRLAGGEMRANYAGSGDCAGPTETALLNLDAVDLAVLRIDTTSARNGGDFAPCAPAELRIVEVCGRTTSFAVSVSYLDAPPALRLACPGEPDTATCVGACDAENAGALSAP
jgi:hypothetical protein